MKVPARSPALVACGQSATDTRHDRRASGYESPPGARRPARAPPGGGRWRRLPAGRGDGAGTGRAGVAAAGQQQPPSSIDLGHRRPAKPARPDDRTPGAHHRARAEVGPRHVRQPCRAEGLPPTRGRVADLLRSATRQIVASDHSGLPMVTADGSSPSSGCCRRRTRRHLHVAAPRRLRQHGPRRLGGGSSDRLRTRPAASLVRRPGDAQGKCPRHTNVGRADDDVPRITKDGALREQDDVPRGTTGTSSAPGLARFPRSDTCAHWSRPGCTFRHRSLGGPADRRSCRLGRSMCLVIGSVPSVFHVEHPIGAAPVVLPPRTDLGSLPFTPCRPKPAALPPWAIQGQ